MGSAHHALHNAEHAAHAGSDHAHDHHAPKDRTGTYIGLTMALLGVMLALCSAMVGASRTDLIKAMVEQSDAHAKYQAQATKHRMALVQLRAVHAQIPQAANVAKVDAELGKLAGEGPDHVSPAMLEALKIATHNLMAATGPEPSDALALAKIARKYEAERLAAKAWLDAYPEIIEAHAEGAEHYEWAQLAAEIGIVVASIALLLASRKAWGAALVAGAVCIGVMGWTYTDSHRHVSHSEHALEAKAKAYETLKKSQASASEDEELLSSVEHAFPGHEPTPAPANAAPPAVEEHTHH